MRVLLSGGGTGGHVYPILAVVSALKMPSPPAEKAMHLPDSRRPAQTGRTPDHGDQSGANLPEGSSRVSSASGPNGEIDATDAGARLAKSGDVPVLCYLGEPGGIEEVLASRAGIPFKAVETGQIRGRALGTAVRNLARMRHGIRQCETVLREFQPDVVLITGGYVAAPAAWAAWRHKPRIPLLIYLPDLTPGLSVQLTSRLAAKVAVSFPEVAHYFGRKAVVTGYPVRPELLVAGRSNARAALKLEAGLPAVLVFGGSRGARSINQALVGALPELLPRCQVIHVSGTLDWDTVSQAAGALTSPMRERYRPYPYMHEEMIQALAAADLVVARAGASTLGEFPAAGVPSILVPYPYAGQHQDANAAYLAERGAALVIPDREIVNRLAATVLDLLSDTGRLTAMAIAAAKLARPNAASAIAQELYRLAGVSSS